jgi:hypothetical protein
LLATEACVHARVLGVWVDVKQGSASDAVSRRPTVKTPHPQKVDGFTAPPDLEP